MDAALTWNIRKRNFNDVLKLSLKFRLALRNKLGVRPKKDWQNASLAVYFIGLCTLTTKSLSSCALVAITKSL